MINKKQLRDFGLIWAGIFVILAFYPLIKNKDVRFWQLYLSITFVVISLTYPIFYQKTYFYQAWIKFGNILGKINSKIIIFLLFYIIFLPIGVLLKIFRKDLLNKKIDKSAKSYFIDCKEQNSDMNNQF